MLAILLLACDAPSPDDGDRTPFEPTVPDDSAPPDDSGTGGPTVPPPDPPAILLNEIQSDNESTIQEEDGSFSDWFELYNASGESVALDRIAVWCDGVAWRGGGGDLGPNEHLLVKADGGLIEGSAPWRISADGERLTVTVDEIETDTKDPGPLPSDVAALRFPDGGDWRTGIVPTPGAPNVEAGTDSLDPRDTLFQRDRITVLEITLSDEAYHTLRTSYKEEVEASIEIDGIHFPEVALKLKGSGSYQSIEGKAAFKIDLDDFDDSRRMRGLKKLTFDNGVTWDPTWTHEWLTYSLFRAAGIAAPRVGWTRISVNGADYGLYMNVETWDDELLEVWFGDANEGSLYEGWDFTSPEYFKLEEGPERMDWIESVADHVGWGSSGEDMDALEALIDVDEFTTYMAVEAITLQFDGYQAPNNWRLYIDSNDVGRWVPTGVDFTWSYAFSNCYYGNGTVFVACLDDDECRDTYSEKLIEVADIAESMNLVDEFDEITEFLTDDIESDPRTPHVDSTIADAQETTRELLETMPAFCRERAEDELGL
jgi:hypothetical protein